MHTKFSAPLGETYGLILHMHLCKKVRVLCSFLPVLDGIAFIYNLAPFIFNPVRMHWSSFKVFLSHCLLFLHLLPLLTKQVAFAIHPEDVVAWWSLVSCCFLVIGDTLLKEGWVWFSGGWWDWWSNRICPRTWDSENQLNLSGVHSLKRHWYLIVSAYPVNVPEWNVTKMFSKNQCPGKLFQWYLKFFPLQQGYLDLHFS